MTPSASSTFRALLAGSVDYAGLFPPAGLALEPALENHSSYARSDESWMLGCFVLPTVKLLEAGPLLAGRFNRQQPLRVSALGSRSNSADEFLKNLRVSLQELVNVPPSHQEVMAISQLECALPLGIDPVRELSGLLSDAAGLIASLTPSQLRVFWEIPFSENLLSTLSVIADHNVRNSPATRRSATPRFQPDGEMLYYSPAMPAAPRRSFGVKLRTGGTEVAAFPACGQLAQALVAAREAGVAVKFTAGLHHPLRHFDTLLGTRMHGFLNVFAAGILGREHRLDVEEVTAILEDEEADSFQFDCEGFAWRDRRILTGALAAHREFITSFGSCSFDEPRDDLRALGLM